MNATTPAPLQSSSGLRCREVGERDIESIVDLLTRGFVVRSRDYWVLALDRLMRHPTPPGLPKLGYLLEHDGIPVGVVLLIFSVVPGGAASVLRCNVSSWYVEPAFRSFASLLVLRALKHKHVTYMNISPAPHTRATIEAQGFSRYCNGQLLALPIFSGKSPEISVQGIGSIPRPDDEALAAEFDLLKTHADLGCVCLWCTSEAAHLSFCISAATHRQRSHSRGAARLLPGPRRLCAVFQADWTLPDSTWLALGVDGHTRTNPRPVRKVFCGQRTQIF